MQTWNLGWSPDGWAASHLRLVTSPLGSSSRWKEVTSLLLFPCLPFPLGPYWSHLLMQMKSWKWRSKKKKTSNMLVPRDWIRLAPWRLEGRHPRTAAPQQCAEPDTGSEPALNPTKVLSLFWNPPTALLFTNSGRKWQINPFFKRMSRFLVTLCTAQDMIVPSA